MRWLQSDNIDAEMHLRPDFDGIPGLFLPKRISSHRATRGREESSSAFSMSASGRHVDGAPAGDAISPHAGSG